MYFLSGLPLLIALSVNLFITGGHGQVSLVTYALGQIMPLLIGTEFVVTSFDVFVPLVRSSSCLPRSVSNSDK